MGGLMGPLAAGLSHQLKWTWARAAWQDKSPARCYQTVRGGAQGRVGYSSALPCPAQVPKRATMSVTTLTGGDEILAPSLV